MKSVYCAVGTGSLNSVFCPHNAFMCFVWISEQTAIISIYSLNLPVFITEPNCVYWAVRPGSLNQTDTVSYLKGEMSDGRCLILISDIKVKVMTRWVRNFASKINSKKVI